MEVIKITCNVMLVDSCHLKKYVNIKVTKITADVTHFDSSFFFVFTFYFDGLLGCDVRSCNFESS